MAIGTNTCRGCGLGNMGAEIVMSGWHTSCFINAIKNKSDKDIPNPFKTATEERARREAKEREERWEQAKQAAREADERARRETEEEWQQRQQRWKEAEERRRRVFGEWQRNFYNQRPQQPAAPPQSPDAITVAIDSKRLKQLLTLCHPDKHGNSERATEITRWLLEIKDRIEKKSAV